MAKLRIDRILSETGTASRRACAGLIRSGAVTANGTAVRSPSEKYDPETDAIAVNGVPLAYERYRYVMLCKPAGVISATEDRSDRTVLDLLGEEYEPFNLFPAGRLDRDAEGLMLLTDDGDFAHRVISPKKNVDKLYYVRTEGTLTQDDCKAFAAGITLGDGTQCLPGALYLLSDSEALVRIHEGKFHQVKRMLGTLGKPVIYLRRLSIGGLVLDRDLAPGSYRAMTPQEAQLIFTRSADEALETLLKDGSYRHYV